MILWHFFDTRKSAFYPQPRIYSVCRNKSQNGPLLVGHLCIKCETCGALLMVDNMPNITFARVLNDTVHGRDVLFVIC